MWREVKSEMLKEVKLKYDIPEGLAPEHIRLFYVDEND